MLIQLVQVYHALELQYTFYPTFYTISINVSSCDEVEGAEFTTQSPESTSQVGFVISTMI